MKIPSLMEMLASGLHFGHQISRWHPKMKPYIFTQRNGIHVINLERTRAELEQTLAAVKQMAAEGRVILFATTKPQGREIVKQAAIDCGMPYIVERWMGGLLTNFPEMKRLFKKYLSLKTQQASGELERYTKSEQARLAKELVKKDKFLSGLAHLEKLPDALFIPSVQREKTAVTEANRMKVPIIGVCDTNANPDKVTHVIPGNDDAVNAIIMIAHLVRDAIKDGRAEWEKKEGARKSLEAAEKSLPKKEERVQTIAEV